LDTPLRFERPPVVDVVADVLLVGQNLMYGSAGPGAAKVGRDAAGVEDLGDFLFPTSLPDEHLVDPLDDTDRFFRATDQDHPVGLQALLLAPNHTQSRKNR
jgi:hypothetical protein